MDKTYYEYEVEYHSDGNGSIGPISNHMLWVVVSEPSMSVALTAAALKLEDSSIIDSISFSNDVHLGPDVDIKGPQIKKDIIAADKALGEIRLSLNRHLWPELLKITDTDWETVQEKFKLVLAKTKSARNSLEAAFEKAKE